MGNKQSNGDTPAATKTKHNFSIDATPGEIYAAACHAKAPLEQADLFNQAGKLYKDEEQHGDAALCFKRAAQIYNELDENMDSADNYQEAFMCFSLMGSKFYNDFKECCDEAISLTADSKYKKSHESCLSRISQAILRITDGLSDKHQVKDLLQSGMFNRYLKGDHYRNGFQKMMNKLKQLEIQDMRLWAIFLKQGVDYFNGEFDLFADDERDKELAVIASSAVLCAYLYSFQTKKQGGGLQQPSPLILQHQQSQQQQPTSPYPMSPTPTIDAYSSIRRSRRAPSVSSTHSHPSTTPAYKHDAENFYAPEPNYVDYVSEFRLMDRFKKYTHQYCMNIMGACQDGDLEAIEETFHDFFASFGYNKFGLLEYLQGIYLERMEVYYDNNHLGLKASPHSYNEERWKLDIESGLLESCKPQPDPKKNFDHLDDLMWSISFLHYLVWQTLGSPSPIFI